MESKNSSSSERFAWGDTFVLICRKWASAPDVYLAAVCFCEPCQHSWPFLCLCGGQGITRKVCEGRRMGLPRMVAVSFCPGDEVRIGASEDPSFLSSAFLILCAFSSSTTELRCGSERGHASPFAQTVHLTLVLVAKEMGSSS